MTNTGTVSTNGFGAAGILAQSIQGAGGAAGDTNSVVSIGSTAGSAASTTPGLVTVTNSGIVTTTGDAAIGVHAQSIGGGGGDSGGPSSTQQTPGGKVKVNVTFALGSNPLSSEDDVGGNGKLASVTLYGDS